MCLPPSQRDPVDFDQAVAHLQAAVGGAAGRDLRHEVLRIQDQAQGALASGDGYAELLLGRRRAGIAGRAPARACTGTQCTGCCLDCTRTGRLPGATSYPLSATHVAALRIKRRAISGCRGRGSGPMRRAVRSRAGARNVRPWPRWRRISAVYHPLSAGPRALALLSLAASAVGAVGAVGAASAVGAIGAVGAVGAEVRISISTAEVRICGTISGVEVQPVDLLPQRVDPREHCLLRLASEVEHGHAALPPPRGVEQHLVRVRARVRVGVRVRVRARARVRPA